MDGIKISKIYVPSLVVFFDVFRIVQNMQPLYSNIVGLMVFRMVQNMQPLHSNQI